MTKKQSDINEYVEQESRPPVLRPDAPVEAPTAKGRIVVGHRGPIPARSDYGFVQFCTRDEHFHRKEAGYALSESVIRRIRSMGCKRVLFAEEDTGIVYEFHISQFTEQVAKHNNPNHDVDPQRKVEITMHRGKWHDHADDVLLDEQGEY